MKKIIKIILLATIIVSTFNIGYKNTYAADSSDADWIFEQIKKDAEEAAKQSGNTYEQTLSTLKSVMLDKNDKNLENLAGSAPSDQLRVQLGKMFDQEIANSVAGGTAVPSGLTDTQKSEIDRNVNDFINSSKNNANYKQLLEQQMNSQASAYTEEEKEYRRNLYQREYNRVVAIENVNKNGNISQIANGMTEQELNNEINQLNSDLARYLNMSSSYVENGKTREQLVLEAQLKLEEYNKALGNKTHQNNPSVIAGNNGGASTGTLGTSGASSSHSPDEIISEAEGFLQQGANNGVIDGTHLKNASSTLYNLLLSIGIFLAVAIGMYLGVKFMTSSVEGKAKVKEALIPYIAGCVVIFSAFIIWRIVIILFRGIA